MHIDTYVHIDIDSLGIITSFAATPAFISASADAGTLIYTSISVNRHIDVDIDMHVDTCIDSLGTGAASDAAPAAAASADAGKCSLIRVNTFEFMLSDR